MDKLFSTLCDSLENELERQENILEVCAATQRAAEANDVEYLEAKTIALVSLLQEAIKEDTSRRGTLLDISRAFGLASPQPTLSAVIEVAPAPWNERLAFYQSRLKQVVNDTRPLVVSNVTTLRAALRVVKQCLQHIQPHPQSAVGYNAGGAEPAAKHHQPAVIDHKG